MQSSSDVLIERITSASDLPSAFEVNCKAFGEQTKDGIWTAIFPKWDTQEGKQQAVARLKARLEEQAFTKAGDSHSVFLKATIPAQNPSKDRIIAGFAIWMQASAVDGFGEQPLENEISDQDLETLFPGDSKEQRYLRQLLLSLHKRRQKVIKEKISAQPPAVFVLDSCAVDPAYQRRGIAKKLVRWGLEEAHRRGSLECITEGSKMGRGVYIKEGFRAEGTDMEFDVDEEFLSRDRPPNLFLRTGGTV